MATVGTIAVNAIANIAPFASGTKQMQTHLQELQSTAVATTTGFSEYANQLLALTGISLTAAAAVGSVNEQIAKVDALGTAAETLGLTTQQLQGYQHAAAMANVGSETLEAGIGKLTKRIGEAITKGKEASEAFKTLGLDTKKLADQSVAQSFDQVVAKIAAIDNPTERATAAYNVFGKSAQQLMPLLSGGAAGMREAAAEAERLGIILTDTQVAAIRQSDDALTALNATYQAVVQKIAVALAPSIIYVSESLTGMWSWWNKNADALIAWTMRISGAVIGATAFVAAIFPAASAVVAFIGVVHALNVALATSQAIQGNWTAMLVALGGAVSGFAIAEIGTRDLRASLQKLQAELGKGKNGVSELAKAFADLEEKEKKVKPDKALEKLKSEADRLKEKFRTPGEVFIDSIKKAKELVSSGLFDAADYARAVADAGKEWDKATKEKEKHRKLSVEGTGAVEAGTTAGFSAIQSALREGRERQTKAAEETAAATKATAAKMDLLIQATRGNGVKIVEAKLP